MIVMLSRRKQQSSTLHSDKKFTKSPRNNNRRPPASNIDNNASKSSGSETDDDDIEKVKRTLLPRFGSEHIQVVKLLKYAKIGNPTATVLALVALRDLTITNDSLQRCILDADGVGILCRVVQSKHLASKIGALQILNVIVRNPLIRDGLIRCDGLNTLVASLKHPHSSVASLAASTLAIAVLSRRIQRLLRQSKGIDILISKLCQRFTTKTSSLQSRPRNGYTYENSVNASSDIKLNEIISFTTALWQCCKNHTNKRKIAQSQLKRHIKDLAKFEDEQFLIPFLGLVEECTNDAQFRQQIIKDKILVVAGCYLRHFDSEVRLLATKLIFNCANEPMAKLELDECDGLNALSENFKSYRDEKDLEITCGTIARLMDGSIDNLEMFQSTGVAFQCEDVLRQHNITMLSKHCLDAMRLLYDHDIEYQNHVTNSDLHNLILKLISQTNIDVVVAALRFIATVATSNAEFKSSIIDKDGLRLCWSHLKALSYKAVVYAGDAINALIIPTQNEKLSDDDDIPEAMRSLVGGLELLVRTLKTENEEIAASILRVLSNVVPDEQNAFIVYEYGVLQSLQKHCQSDLPAIQMALSACITNFNASIESNDVFLHIIPLLCGWLVNTTEDVQKACTHALKRLSTEARNCALMHGNDAVKPLLALMAVDDYILQESIATCVKNIRMNVVSREESNNKTSNVTNTKRKLQRKQKKADEIKNNTSELDHSEHSISRLSGYSQTSYRSSTSSISHKQTDKNESELIAPSSLRNSSSISLNLPSYTDQADDNQTPPLPVINDTLSVLLDNGTVASYRSAPTVTTTNNANLKSNGNGSRATGRASVIDVSVASAYDYGSSDFESDMESSRVRDSDDGATDGLDTNRSINDNETDRFTMITASNNGER